jgi:CDP-diacylglycerol pyrophosphatase
MAGGLEAMNAKDTARYFPVVVVQPTGYLLRFQSLFDPGRALMFPCDAGGHVYLDALSEAARRNYFYARAVVGREFAIPAVVGETPGPQH